MIFNLSNGAGYVVTKVPIATQPVGKKRKRRRVGRYALPAKRRGRLLWEAYRLKRADLSWWGVQKELAAQGLPGLPATPQALRVAVCRFMNEDLTKSPFFRAAFQRAAKSYVRRWHTLTEREQMIVAVFFRLVLGG